MSTTRRLLSRADPTPPIAPVSLRPREAAKALGVSQRTLDRLIAEGRIRTVKIGPSQQNARLVPVAELQAFLAGAGAEGA